MAMVLTEIQKEKLRKKATLPPIYRDRLYGIKKMSNEEAGILIKTIIALVEDFYNNPDEFKFPAYSDDRFLQQTFEDITFLWEEDTRKYLNQRKGDENLQKGRKKRIPEEEVLPFMEEDIENAPSGKTRAEETIKSMSEINHDLPGQMTIDDYFKNGGDE